MRRHGANPSASTGTSGAGGRESRVRAAGAGSLHGQGVRAECKQGSSSRAQAKLGGVRGRAPREDFFNKLCVKLTNFLHISRTRPRILAV